YSSAHTREPGQKSDRQSCDHRRPQRRRMRRDRQRLERRAEHPDRGVEENDTDYDFVPVGRQARRTANESSRDGDDGERPEKPPRKQSGPIELERRNRRHENVERERSGLHHTRSEAVQAHHCEVRRRARVADRRIERRTGKEQNRNDQRLGNGHVLSTYIFLLLDPRSRNYMTEYAIDIVNVTKRYAEHTAVRDLTLRVPTGSVYGLLGPNGAGKTTTIRMILNIIAPDSGAIHIFGRLSSD